MHQGDRVDTSSLQVVGSSEAWELSLLTKCLAFVSQGLKEPFTGEETGRGGGTRVGCG